MEEPVIRTDGLTKSFQNPGGEGTVTAVSDLSIEVSAGEIYGFLGPNGAGKTTTIKMLLGLIYPTAGTATVLDKPLGDVSARMSLSYLPESPYFYEHLTAGELLEFYGRLFHIPGRILRDRIAELLNLVGLEGAGRKRLSQFSKGMLQRIGIAQSLINDPELLFFDEPTSGLDPIAHIEIRDLILQIKKRGKTIFLSSHQLEDVEKVCDRVSIIYDGVLHLTGMLGDLLSGEEFEMGFTGVNEEGAAPILAAGTQSSKVDGGWRLLCPAGEADSMVDSIRAAGGSLTSLARRRKTLEEVFVDVVREATGRDPVEMKLSSQAREQE